MTWRITGVDLLSMTVEIPFKVSVVGFIEESNDLINYLPLIKLAFKLCKMLINLNFIIG